MSNMEGDREGKESVIRLVCISDTHTQHEKLGQLPKGDILVHTGDFANRGVDQIQDFNNWLATVPFKHKVVIAGNQEYIFNELERDVIQRDLLPNCTYLEDSGATIEGIRFWGSPWQGSRNMAFSADRSTRAEKWALMPSDGSVDVLLTHMPPYQILDRVRGSGKSNWGCPGLEDRVLNAVRPPLHVFGHVHDTQEGGMRAVRSQESGVTFVNAASKPDGGVACTHMRPPVVIDFNRATRTVQVVTA